MRRGLPGKLLLSKEWNVRSRSDTIVNIAMNTFPKHFTIDIGAFYYDKHARKWSKERVHEVLDGSDCFDVDIDIDDSDDDVDVESNHGEQQ